MDLILEIFSDEIPAHVQRLCDEVLKQKATDLLNKNGIFVDDISIGTTPNRLVLIAKRNNPFTGASQEVFQATIQKVLESSMPELINSFVDIFPKTMRWGNLSALENAPRWIRPVKNIMCILDFNDKKPKLVEFKCLGLTSNTKTFVRGQEVDIINGSQLSSHGYRPLPGYISLFLDQDTSIFRGKRKEIIKNEMDRLLEERNLEAYEDEALLEEVVGLVETPTIYIGEFDTSFLALPMEVIQTTIRNNQKSFITINKETKEIANTFVIVSNNKGSDGGKKIIAGNERVVASRLSDAFFFWNNDFKTSLREKLEAGNTAVVHRLLGTQKQKVERVKSLILTATPILNLDNTIKEESLTIAELMKADLSSQMVVEFPELQGVVGKYYALHEGYSQAIAQGIQDHYKPKGSADTLPVTVSALLVALVDKIDTLVGFWAGNEPSTGSKDPYALRRGVLGVIRIINTDSLAIEEKEEFLNTLFDHAISKYQEQGVSVLSKDWKENLQAFLEKRSELKFKREEQDERT